MVVQQTTQDVTAMKGTILTAVFIRDRCLLVQALVRMRFIGEGEVVDHQPESMALVED
jgi:hypothetical protein